MVSQSFPAVSPDGRRMLLLESTKDCRIFHVRYAGQKALFAIETLTLLRGTLSPRTLAMVTEWAALHRAELLEDWALAREEAELKPIAPLE